MTPFQCVPIPTETAERFRRTGLDDSGNTLRRMTVPPESSATFPCRHCLRPGAPGEAMLLGSYDLPGPSAPIIRVNPLVSVRAYDAADQCLYDLGHVGHGAEVDVPLDRALSDPRTAFVNVHTARPGCLLARVERLAG
jgi:hypothetical protein